jgi:hypothetical protein
MCGSILASTWFTISHILEAVPPAAASPWHAKRTGADRKEGFMFLLAELSGELRMRVPVGCVEERGQSSAWRMTK